MQINQIIRKIPRLPIPLFGSVKLRLAFEFGVIMSDVARGMKIELTPEIVSRAEEILLDQCKRANAVAFAGQMNACALAAFQPVDWKKDDTITPSQSKD